MSLALHWAPPVFLGLAALTVFCTILRVGLTASGDENFWSYSITDFVLIWLWLALVVWFALISGYFFLWIAAAALVLFGIFKGRCACNNNKPS
jgi:hypothetical protein